MNYLIAALALIIVPLGIISWWQLIRFCLHMSINKQYAVSDAAAKTILER